MTHPACFLRRATNFSAISVGCGAWRSLPLREGAGAGSSIGSESCMSERMRCLAADVGVNMEVEERDEREGGRPGGR